MRNLDQNLALTDFAKRSEDAAKAIVGNTPKSFFNQKKKEENLIIQNISPENVYDFYQ